MPTRSGRPGAIWGRFSKQSRKRGRETAEFRRLELARSFSTAQRPPRSWPARVVSGTGRRHRRGLVKGASSWDDWGNAGSMAPARARGGGLGQQGRCAVGSIIRRRLWRSLLVGIKTVAASKLCLRRVLSGRAP